jgi:arylsulfatase A-like enzyme
MRDLYEGEVRYVDAHIGRFLDTLRALDIYDDALIIFVSDHGEDFLDHGGLGHGHTLYNELVRVPLFVKLPGSRNTGRIDEVVSTAAIAPTILKVCGLSYHEDDFSFRALPLESEETTHQPNSQPIRIGE